MSGGASRVGLGGNTGGGRPNGAVAAPNGGSSATPGLRAASGITKPEADVWYLNEDGDTATGLLALDGGATVGGNPLALDPAAGNALTWTEDGLYAPPLEVPPEYVTEDELASALEAGGFLDAAAADALFLTPAEGDAAYAALGHTHPSEESGPWRFQDTVGGTPGSGYLRTNTGALATAGQLIISRTTQDGYDIPPPGWGLQADDTIYIQDRDDSTKWVRYVALEPLVRFPTYATGLVTVTGSAGGTIVNGQIIQVTFSLAGGGGGGGEAVTSVNGETGDVMLDAADVGALTQTQGDARYLPLTAQSHNHTTGDGSGVLSNEEHDGYSQYANLGADPSTPGTNLIRLYAKDNGAGVATLYYRTESGEIYELPTLSTGGGGGSGAPSNASYITTTTENKLSQERVLGTAVIMSGTLASRPAFGTAGRLYLATDSDLVYRDTGSAWETFATRAITDVTVTTDPSLTATESPANTFALATRISGDADNALSVHADGLYAAGVGGGGGALVLLAEQVLGAAAAAITFSSIAQTYRTLVLEFVGRSDGAGAAGGGVAVGLRFNNDSAANYDYMVLRGSGATAGTLQAQNQTSAVVANVPQTTDLANACGWSRVEVPLYAATTFLKVATGTYGTKYANAANGIITGRVDGGWRSTAAVTRVDVLPSSGNLVAGTYAALYGMS